VQPEHGPIVPRRPGSRQWLPLIIVVALAFAIIVPPLFNIERYQHRIAVNISRSLGRQVHFSHISLRLLPRPGFDLTDFTVEEGPGFGAEPILHSSSVSASIRLLSLWRGRLEIARIALDEPSLNLVRNPAGKWNFASVVTQASLTPVAPTGQATPGHALRFPYIEATNARINFKYGDEKQPFSFMNGDLSLWLENPQEWQLRFAAQPVRTDLDLFASNTGLVRIEGSLKRAPALGEIPLHLRTEWTKAPIGQISRLFGGEDFGWRGELDLRSRLSGTPSELLMDTAMQLNDLHRVEFQPERAMDYSADCKGTYRKAVLQLGNLACTMPVGNGTIAVTGTVGSPLQPAGTQLNISMEKLPAVAVLNFLRLTRQGLGKDLSVGGSVDGKFAIETSAAHTTLAGDATAEELSMSGPSMSGPLALNGIHLSVLDAHPVSPATARSRPAHIRSTQASSTPLSLLLAPVKIDFGAPNPLLVDGRFDRRGFLLHFGGRAELARLLPALRSVGLDAPGLQSLQPTGDATLDVQLRGPWLLPIEAYAPDGAALAPTPTGTITLRDARLQTAYLASPLIIKSAAALLPGPQEGGTPGTQITWSGIVAQYGPIHFTGSFRAPLPCHAERGAAADCTRQFDLNLPSLDIGALAGVLGGSDPLVQVLLSHIESNPTGPDWPPLHGTLRAATANLGNLDLADTVASIGISGSRVKIESLDARAFDGTLHMSGTLNAGPTPSYQLNAQLNQVSVAAIGQMFHQAWGSGTINVATQLSLSGSNREDLLSSAHGMFHFDWSHGGLKTAAGGAAGRSAIRSPFAHFEEWTADGVVQDQGIDLEQSLLTLADGARAIDGTIGFNTQLDLKSTAAPAAAPTVESGTAPASESGTLTGTLAAPEFAATAPQP